MAYAASQSIDAADIPVIDIAPLREGSDPERVARDLRRAATEVGFLYVRNHGVPETVIDTARAVARDFFALPAARKDAVAVNTYHHGFLRIGGAKMDDDAKADLKESFIWGLELDDAGLAAVRDNPLLGPNVWPADMPALKDAVYPYFEAAHRCAADLLRGFAIAFGLPDDAFLKSIDRPLSRASVTYYPPQPPHLGADQFGVAPHTDFGVLTVLSQDDIGGLEIQDLNGDWIAATPIPGTLVVNVGDLLTRWTNDQLRSTPHRVINKSGRERLSLVAAYDPNYETLIDPAMVCRAGETPHYAPITCGDYLMWRFKKAFAYRQ